MNTSSINTDKLTFGKREITAIRFLSELNTADENRYPYRKDPLRHRAWLYFQNSTVTETREILKDSDSIELELRLIFSLYKTKKGIVSMDIKPKRISEFWSLYGKCRPLPLMLTVESLVCIASTLISDAKRMYELKIKILTMTDNILSQGVLHRNSLLLKDGEDFPKSSESERVTTEKIRSMTPQGVILDIVESIDQEIGVYNPGDPVITLSHNCSFEEFIEVAREHRMYHLIRKMAADFSQELLGYKMRKSPNF